MEFSKEKMDYLDSISREVRAQIIELCNYAKSAHLGSCLSCVDILVAAYWNVLDITTIKNKEKISG